MSEQNNPVRSRDSQREPVSNGTSKSETALREEKILEFWNKNEIFKKTLEKDSPKGNFVFYDGPVTSNAKPVFHTLEPFAFKDIIPRFKTMRGFHVPRKGGWDTHGLPVELQIEKKLDFKSKKDIEEYGIAAFNKLCKESVGEYIGAWQDFTKRMGYWADQEHPYVTYDNSYIESIWNIVQTVNEKGLLYKDYKVLPWCPRCGTALSSHELALGYQDDKDLSVTARFMVESGKKIGDYITDDKTFILAWTTTPWTLPGNVALAVGEEIMYVLVLNKETNEKIILSKANFPSISESVGNYEVVGKIKGKDLVGLKYEPLYPFLAEKFKGKDPEAFEKSYQVYGADFVNTTDGTGVVHTAVMYGQDDFVLGTTIGLPKFHLVKDNGHFLDDMQTNTIDLSNRFAKDEEVAVDIIKDLAHRGLLFKKEKYEHSYPHCWRCKTPLIYYARDSWYISMSKLRDELMKENDGINWEPAHIKEGRFGEWLREIKDWAISRERYWGTPLPIWSDADGNYRVIGSIDELKKLSKKSGNKYFIMRHGETEGNVKGVWNVDSNIPNPLTEKGKKQVVDSTKNLKDKSIDLIFVSPFSRTQETANLIIDTLDLNNENIIVDSRIGEWNVGEDFDGKPVEDYFKVRNASPDRYKFKNDAGESYEDVLKRAGDFIYDIDKKYSGKNILIISHGAVTRAMTLVSQGFSFKQISDDGFSFKNFDNAEIRQTDFSLLPHNEQFEVDLHKPYIDSVELIDEKGVTLKRVKEVMDVWFDSGAMPFAQDHYPWNEGELAYPADFISEAIDQTRGWFYTLHAIGVLMGKGKAFRNVICLGHVLDKDGKKMSKSIGNVLDPWDLMNKYGVDALRLWMYTVNQPGDSKNFDEKTVDEMVKKVFNPILNIVAFYDLYKDPSIKPHNKSKNVLDRWIISRLSELVGNGTNSLEDFKVFESARPIRDFASDFSTWYIRRSRDRFKSEDVNEKNDALSTTHFVLLDLIKYMAPFTPFFSEEIYQKIKMVNDPESVHLCVWPEENNVEEVVLEDMQKVRDTVTKALELRQKAGHSVRQPLSTLTIGENFSKELLDIIADEVNVKRVLFEKGVIRLDTNLSQELINEGIARGIIRGIQDLRKQENLNPGNKIKIIVCAPEKIQEVFNSYAQMIKPPTQTIDLSFSNDKQPHVIALSEHNFSISIVK